LLIYRLLIQGGVIRVRAFIFLMLFCVSAIATDEQDVSAAVGRCVPGPVMRAVARLATHPTDENAFTDLFLGVNENLAKAIETRYRLGGDDGMEVAQAILNRVWNGEIKWEGPAPLSEDQVHTWLMSHAGIELSKLRGTAQGKGQVKAFNVTPDTKNGDDFDLLAGTTGSVHTQETLTQEMIDRLPDALHRFVLMRLKDGKKYEEIATELGKSPNHIGMIAREARASLSEVLKGRDPIVRTTYRDTPTAALVESILERELATRPILMPEEAVTITEEKFWEILGERKESSKEILRDYFLHGKRGTQIARDRGLADRVVRGVLERASKKLSSHLAEEPGALGIDRIWIVNEEGFPVSPFRQLDYARVSTAPLEISGDRYWEATKDLDIRVQEILQMRFVEGLSAGYIAKTLGLAPHQVHSALYAGVKAITYRWKIPATIDDLVVTGDTSMVHTTEVKIPAKLYFRRLAEGGDPSEYAKLELASRISGLPIRNLARVTLVDDNRAPIFDSRSYWHALPTSPEKITSPDFRVIQSRLSAEDAEILDLHLRHRWNVRSLAYHYGKSPEDMDRALVRGRIAIASEMGRYIGLPQIVIQQTARRPQTIQVPAEGLKAKLAEVEHPSLENLNQVLVDWKNRKVESLENLELMNTEGKPIFTHFHETVAPDPKNPVTMSVEDFEKGLALTTLSENEIKAMRMRFRYGWGSSAISFLLGIPPRELNNLLTRGNWNLAQNSGGETIAVDGLKLIEEGTAEITLQKTGVELSALATRVRDSGKYTRQAVRGAAASLSGKPSLRLDEIIPTDSNGRALGDKKDRFFHPAPDSPERMTVGQVESFIQNEEQLLAMKLRYQYFWGPQFIAAVMQKSPADVERLLNAGYTNLKRKDPQILRTNLMIVD